MDTQRLCRALSAACVFAAAGLAAPALAQIEQPERRPGYVQPAQPVQVGVWHFHRAGALIGRDVEDGAGEDIATVKDFIFDTGSGRVSHAVLSAGGVLGLGAKDFAVPYSMLRHVEDAEEGVLDDEDDHFVIDMTKEEIERAPEFRAEEWANLDHTTWWQETRSQFAGRDGDWDDDWDGDDAYGEKVKGAEQEELTGTVKSVERGEGGDGHTMLVVETDQGDEKKVVLGPSWYTMCQEGTPYREDRVSLKVCPIEDGDADYVALSCKRTDQAGEEFTLRDEEGAPYWTRREGAVAAGASMPKRLMLVSDLVGAEATLPSREEQGEIEGVVIETQSGRIVLVGLDPNENFLGMGDDVIGVPWPVVRIVDSDTVRIDATEEMLTRSEELPDDVTVLATPARLEPVYTVYEVEIIPLEPRRTTMIEPGEWDDQAAGGDAIEALRSGEDVTVSGRVTNVSHQAIEGFSGPMTVATIETDEGSRDVVLGSKSYFDENPLMLTIGDEVHIEAKRADCHGREVFAATMLDANGQETALWDGDRPVWQDE